MFKTSLLNTARWFMCNLTVVPSGWIGQLISFYAQEPWDMSKDWYIEERFIEVYSDEHYCVPPVYMFVEFSETIQ